MTAKLTKKRKSMQPLYEKEKLYKLNEAMDILKNAPKSKFDETVELAMNLGLNPKDPQQAIRGTATLPHGTGKKIRVCVFCKVADEQKAKDAGADFVGSEELVKKISGGWCDFDVAIASSAMMREIAKLGRVLGPRGLMPNPKTGTVTDDIEKTIKEVKAGKIEFKMDKQGGIHVGVGKISFEKDAISENVRKLIKAIFSSNPNLNKPQMVKSITLTTTMGPGLKLEISEFRK
ncbi:MAG: 50S ribosomal protein L1 [Candidatus Omnitrophica bacterium]|nr:50S ribosomal protein L1 [Candidatus Omnitrophota bacterium]